MSVLIIDIWILFVGTISFQIGHLLYIIQIFMPFMAFITPQEYQLLYLAIFRVLYLALESYFTQVNKSSIQYASYLNIQHIQIYNRYVTLYASKYRVMAG